MLIKNFLYKILIDPNADNHSAKLFNVGMIILISLNLTAVILETVQGLYQRYQSLFNWFEIISVIIFTIEYLLRLWVCSDSKFPKSFVQRAKFAIQPLQLIDLVAILPFYMPFIGVDLRFIRAIRLFRLFRLFKIGRYSQSIKTLGRVVKSKKEELFITLFAGLVTLLMASILMFFVEHEAQPEKFQSILDGMWWGAVTLTTVGYGDVFPITPLGKLLGIVISIFGIGLFAMPAGIIASGFITELQKKKEPIICPHCGLKIEE